MSSLRWGEERREREHQRERVRERRKERVRERERLLIGSAQNLTGSSYDLGP